MDNNCILQFENVEDNLISFGRLGAPVADIWQTSHKGTHQNALPADFFLVGRPLRHH
jgi:hypothetical protein